MASSTVMDRAELLLGHAPVFQGAPAQDVARLAALASFQTVDRGTHLFREGEMLDTLYLVESGSVRVYRLTRGGTRELTLGVAGPRELVAGATAFQSRARADANAVVLQANTEVLALPVATVQEQVFGTPALAQAVISFLARRQVDLLKQMDLLVFSDLNERLAAYLIQHASGPHNLPTNSELAALLGTVPELVSRKLGEFYRLHLIRLERRTVYVTDIVELTRVAAGRKER